MLSLMDQNGGRHRDFLGGKEEVEAFENKEFLRMHTSTLSKVGFLALPWVSLSVANSKPPQKDMEYDSINFLKVAQLNR